MRVTVPARLRLSPCASAWTRGAALGDRGEKSTSCGGRANHDSTDCPQSVETLEISPMGGADVVGPGLSSALGSMPKTVVPEGMDPPLALGVSSRGTPRAGLGVDPVALPVVARRRREPDVFTTKHGNISWHSIRPPKPVVGTVPASSFRSHGWPRSTHSGTPTRPGGSLGRTKDRAPRGDSSRSRKAGSVP